jgi:hypothetical protein
MNPDAAELSSLMTVVTDVALRVAEVARRREDESDDASAGRLQEIERSLVTAGRRMQAVIRDLDESPDE